MPDSEGRPLFSDFDAPVDIERALERAPKLWRSKLVTWQYALLRAEQRGAARPGPEELYVLQQQVLLSLPLVVSVYAVMFAASVVVFVFAAASLIQTGAGPVAVMMLAFAAILLALAFFGAKGRLGPYGKAMRLIWAARQVDRDARSAMLGAALRLETEHQAGQRRA